MRCSHTHKGTGHWELATVKDHVYVLSPLQSESRSH